MTQWLRPVGTMSGALCDAMMFFEIAEEWIRNVGSSDLDDETAILPFDDPAIGYQLGETARWIVKLPN